MLAANYIRSLSQVAQQLQVIKLAVAQVHQLAAGKQFLDGVNGALGLLQMVGKRQDVGALRGEQPVAMVRLREGCAQWASTLDDQRLEQLIAPGMSPRTIVFSKKRKIDCSAAALQRVLEGQVV